jgi:hypothetical protein
VLVWQRQEVQALPRRLTRDATARLLLIAALCAVLSGCGPDPPYLVLLAVDGDYVDQ